MRLALPDGFPDVHVSTTFPGIVRVVPPCGLPGVEVAVWLDNGYGLCLIRGRGYSGLNTVQAMTMTRDGSDSHCGEPVSVPGLTNTSSVEGWVDADWIASALATLADLPHINQED